MWMLIGRENLILLRWTLDRFQIVAQRKALFRALHLPAPQPADEWWMHI